MFHNSIARCCKTSVTRLTRNHFSVFKENLKDENGGWGGEKPSGCFGGLILGHPRTGALGASCSCWRPSEARSTFSSAVCTLHDNPPPKSMGHYNACSNGLMSFKSLTGPRRPPGCSFQAGDMETLLVADSSGFRWRLFEGRGWIVWGVDTVVVVVVVVSGSGKDMTWSDCGKYKNNSR